jgi:hypothetical protein
MFFQKNKNYSQYGLGTLFKTIEKAVNVCLVCLLCEMMIQKGKSNVDYGVVARFKSAKSLRDACFFFMPPSKS